MKSFTVVHWVSLPVASAGHRSHCSQLQENQEDKPEGIYLAFPVREKWENNCHDDFKAFTWLSKWGFEVVDNDQAKIEYGNFSEGITVTIIWCDWNNFLLHRMRRVILHCSLFFHLSCAHMHSGQGKSTPAQGNCDAAKTWKNISRFKHENHWKSHRHIITPLQIHGNTVQLLAIHQLPRHQGTQRPWRMTPGKRQPGLPRRGPWSPVAPQCCVYSGQIT